MDTFTMSRICRNVSLHIFTSIPSHNDTHTCSTGTTTITITYLLLVLG